MNNKKGLSNVVATVLIVLLSLAAVAIVWGFIGPAIQGAGSQIEIADKCLNTELRPTVCKIINDSGNPTVFTLTDLTVELTRGEAESMKFVVKDGDGGDTFVSDTYDAPETTLATETLTNDVVLTKMNEGPFKISAVAVFMNEEGEEAFCGESIELACEYTP